MIVKDLSNSFYPCPKNKIPTKNTKKQVLKEIKKQKKELESDFCIMPKSTKYSTVRTKKYSERHEVFFSKAYRMKSIKDGLIVFLTEEMHRGDFGVHGKNGDKLNRYLKKVAQKVWMDYYKKTEEDFRKRYGKLTVDKEKKNGR